MVQQKYEYEGILPLNKPSGMTAFQLVRILRRRLGVQKIGHAGTLDPFATGVMVMLVGRPYTRLSDQFLQQDKEYIGRVRLGEETDTYDCEGTVVNSSSLIPSLIEIEKALEKFQGEILQVPPMFSAKKVQGKKLYDLARKGIEIERKAVPVRVSIELLRYEYPFLDLRVSCSKGTYIRSIAYDLGRELGCGGHLASLQRTRSGKFALASCLELERLDTIDDLELKSIFTVK